MKKATYTMLAAIAAVCMMVAPTHAQVSASVGADFNSAYVFRGATLNDGFVFQPGIEVSGLGGFTFGAWGNMDLDSLEGTVNSVADAASDGDVDGTADAAGSAKESLDSEFSEVDLYANWGWSPVDGLDLGMGYTEYMYPYAAEARVGADREISASTGISIPFGDALSLDPTLTVFYGLAGGLEDVIQADLASDLSIPLVEDTFGIDLSGRIGYVLDEGDDASYYADSGLRDITLTAATSWEFLGIALNYVVDSDEDVQPLDEDFWVTLSVGKEF